MPIYNATLDVIMTASLKGEEICEKAKSIIC